MHNKTKNQGQKVVSPVSKQGSEMSNFCLKQGLGLKTSAAHLYPNSRGGGGKPHMEGVRMLVGNFELNP